MIKFKDTTLFKSSPRKATIITFEGNTFFTVTGSYMEVLPYLESGIEESKLLELFPQNSENLLLFIDFLKAWDLLKDSGILKDKPDELKNSNGSVLAENIPEYQEEIYAVEKLDFEY